MANLEIQVGHRKCVKCGEIKPMCDFTKSGKSSKGVDYYRTRCRTCYNKKARDYRKERKTSERNKAKRRKIKERLVSFFGGECQRCHGVFPAPCYDFHHLNEDEKQYTISNLMSSSSSPENLKLLYDEAKKCIMLCSNCHRIVHYEEQLIKAEEILNGE